jgi:rubrerythrin
LSLVRGKRIKDAAFVLLSKGAVPDDEYGHELYICPKCNRLANRFYFKLTFGMESYEPDYHCSKCKTQLRRAMLKHKNNDLIEIIYKNNRNAEWKCPECGCGKLIYTGDLLFWD